MGKGREEARRRKELGTKRERERENRHWREEENREK
jgi:hypothetical protein